MRLCLGLLTLLAVVCSSGARAQDAARLGATFETVTPAMMAEQGLAVPFGARMTSVAPAGPAARSGLAVGDIVISVGGKPLAGAPELQAAIDTLAPGATVDLVRVRGKEAPVGIKVTLAAGPGSESAIAPPQLMLDTGGHMAIIYDLMFTPDGKYVVSGGEDKVIRIWDWRTGQTVRTIRGEVGSGEAGKIYAMALSPDGKRLAVGGYVGIYKGDVAPEEEEAHKIRLYEFATGRLEGLLKGHSGIILSLAFSPDGRRLASGSSDRTAIVWDAETRQPVAQLVGHTNSIFDIVFMDNVGHVITASFDHTLRVWDTTTRRAIAEMADHKDKVRSLAIDRKRGIVASGDRSGEIRVWELRQLANVTTPQPGEADAQQPSLPRVSSRFVANIESEVGELAFSPDGAGLVAAFGYNTQARRGAKVFDLTGKLLASHPSHDNIVLAADVSPNGRYAATGGGNSHDIQVWELATGKGVSGPGGKPLRLAGTGSTRWTVGFSEDSASIAWGNTGYAVDVNLRGPFEYELRLPTKAMPLGAPLMFATAGQPNATPLSVTGAQYYRGVTKFGRYELRHRTGGDFGVNAILDVLKDGKVVASIEREAATGYDHRSYSFTPDGRTIVSGGNNGHLHAFDLAAVEAAGRNGVIKGADFLTLARPYIGHESEVWALAPSRDGRYLISGSADQTVRLWNLNTQELIVTLYFGTDGEWVIWTPQGYYTGSPGGGELVGWQINQGIDKEARYVRGRQLRDKLLRPDIVDRAIVLASASAAIREAGLANVSVETLLTQTPPVVLARAWETEAAGGRGIVMVATERNPLPVLDTKITVSDGKQETAVKARARALPPGTPQPDPGTTLRAYEVPLFKGRNTVRIVAVNAAGESEPKEVSITHNGEGALDKRGTLWVLAIGADKYLGAKRITDAATGEVFAYRDLHYAGADATAFAKTAVAEMRARHLKTDVNVLVNGGATGEPTRANILAALERIRANSSETDTILILLAGHGENWTGGRYHFLPTDFKRSSMSEIGVNVIDWKDDIQPAIAGAKGRKLLFLDACYSANAYNTTLLASADADRFVAFSAAGPGQKASEFNREGHGAFTYMLIEALKGAEAALDPLENGVTVYKLGDYVNLKVRERTFGKQTPEFRSGQGNFALTRH